MPDYPIGYEPIGTVALLTSTVGPMSVRHAAEMALERFSRREIEAVAFTAATSDDNPRLIDQALEDLSFDAIVLVGGDTLVGEALQKIVGTGMPIGVIPCGSGNDLARAYRLPTDPGRAAEIIADGFVTTSDVGWVKNTEGDKTYFGTVMCSGADAHAAAKVDDRVIAGQQRWLLSFFAEMVNLDFRHYHIELEGVTAIATESDNARARRVARDGEIPADRRVVIDRRVALATFGNTRSYGAGIFVCPRADHHDGLLDLTIVEKAPLFEYIKGVRRFSMGDHSDLPFVTSYRCRSATVMVGDSDSPIIVDGRQSYFPPVTVGIEPAASRFLVPAP